MPLSNHVKIFDGFFDKIDKPIKRLPTKIQATIGFGVAYGIQQILPGDTASNLWNYTSSGGEYYPGSAVKWLLFQSSTYFDYFTQPLIQRASSLMPVIMDRLNRVPDMVQQISFNLQNIASQYLSLIQQLYSKFI